MHAPFRLGEWTVEPELLRISKGDDGRALGPKLMATLSLLVSRAGGVVTKEELVQEVWSGAFCSDEVVTSMIYELRRALGDRAASPRYVGTVRGRGYRLLETVEPLAPDSDDPKVEPGEKLPKWRSSWHLAASILLLLLAASHWAQQSLASLPGEPTSLAIRQIEAHTTELRTLDLTRDLAADLADEKDLEIFDHFSSAIPPTTHSPRDLFLEGSIEPAEHGLRISLQLLDVERRLLWGGTYEGALDRGSPLRERLSAEVATQIRRHAEASPATGDGDHDLRLGIFRLDSRASGPEA